MFSLLLVFVDDLLGGLHINAGVHRQPLDKGGEGLLLLLVGQLDLLDELVQPQTDRGVRDLVEPGDLLQRAGLERKIFEKGGELPISCMYSHKTNGLSLFSSSHFSIRAGGVYI